jgi:hypothetical protein
MDALRKLRKLKRKFCERVKITNVNIHALKLESVTRVYCSLVN